MILLTRCNFYFCTLQLHTKKCTLSFYLCFRMDLFSSVACNYKTGTNQNRPHNIVLVFQLWLCTLIVVLVLSPPGIEMEIVNSCEKNNGGCSHHCEHTTNGPLCSCNHGYRLDQDRKTCVGKNCSLYTFCLLFWTYVETNSISPRAFLR